MQETPVCQKWRFIATEIHIWLEHQLHVVRKHWQIIYKAKYKVLST